MVADIPSVEDRTIELLSQLLDLSGSLPHALQRRHVHQNQRDFALGRRVALDFFDDGLAFVHVAYCTDHVGAGGVHCSQSLDADS